MKNDIKNESGMTLVESLMAILILTVGLLSMAQVLAYSIVASKTHGRDSGKATAAAREKMDELVALRYADVASNVSVYPNTSSGGTGLTIGGGSVFPEATQTGYFDNLDSTGARTTSEASVAYVRQWKIISVPGAAKLKQIMVSVTSKKSFKVGTAPSTLLITQKAEQKPE